MSSSAVAASAKLISKLLVEEVQFLYGVHDKVEELQDELSWMQAFLHDADKKKHQDELIRKWVSQIQELAYEAEDIVEKYIYKVSRWDRDGSWKTLHTTLFYNIYNAFPLHEVGSGIVKLTKKISKLNERLKSYGIQMGNADPSLYITRMRDKRRTYSNTADEDLIERKEDVQKLVNQLLEEKAESNVTGIVGMGGLGKTTLAREVCRDKAIVDRFTHIVWIYVSPHPQKKSILEDTLRQLGEEMVSEDRLSEKVRNNLTNKCLVVLDDMWDKEVSFLRTNFATSKAKILLTARLEIVKKMDPTGFICKPTLLNPDESWRLLCKKARIKDEDISSSDDKLKKMGREMLKHCQGLPIAIVALGAILATKPKRVAEWEEVLNNITNYLARYTDHDGDDDGEEEEEKGEGVLELSYNELPLYLKPCFLYLGNFPEKSEIPTNTLYQLWEAEGLIQSSAKRNEVKGKSVDIFDIAEQYLHNLVKRCMVEVSQLHENGAIKTCRMHDIMRNLCLKKSVEERFLEVVTIDGPKNSSSHDNLESPNQVWTARRVAINVRNNSAETFFNSFQGKRVELRSLLIDFRQDNEQVPTVKFDMWFSKLAKAFKMLRVLRLQCVHIDKLPDEIGSCIHLRYLSFKLAHASEVPDVVWMLKYLQTLDLQHNDKLLTVPNKLKKLERLAHVYLPVAYHAKEKLQFSQPTQVRTLVNIDLKDIDEEDLKNLTNLRMLSFKEIESTECLSLAFQSKIITSSLVENPFSTISIDAKTVNQNPQMLSSSTDVQFKVITINGMINPNLRDIAFPRTLLSLVLHGSCVQGDCITGIVIPGLKELHLKQNAIRGRKFVVSSESFPKLQKLTLELAGSSELQEVKGTLPKRCLFSISCPKSLEFQILLALQQLQHNRNLIRIEYTDIQLPAEQNEIQSLAQQDKIQLPAQQDDIQSNLSKMQAKYWLRALKLDKKHPTAKNV